MSRLRLLLMVFPTWMFLCLSLNARWNCKFSHPSPEPLFRFSGLTQTCYSLWPPYMVFPRGNGAVTNRREMLAWESGLAFRLYFRILTFVNEMGILTLHFSHANQFISSNEQFKYFFFKYCSCHLGKSGSEFRMLRLGASVYRYSVDESIIRISSTFPGSVSFHCFCFFFSLRSSCLNLFFYSLISPHHFINFYQSHGLFKDFLNY